MSGRRFRAGDRFEIADVKFRIVEGAKKTSLGERGKDLRLDWWTHRGWVPIPFEVLALMVDFLCENEDVLYPQDHELGGQKLWNYLRSAKKHGWRQAEAGLRAEKDFKRSLFEESA